MSNASAGNQRDRERDRAPVANGRTRPAWDDPADPKLKPAYFGAPPPAWMGLDELSIAGLPATVVYRLENWVHSRGVDAFVAGFSRGRSSAIVRWRGECFHCRREHSRNHWVLLESPGFDTSRILCHKTGKAGTGPLFGLLGVRED